MELAMVISVIAHAMAFVGDASHQVGPALGMPAEDEERCSYPSCTERVQDSRGGFRVRTIVERQREQRLVSADVRNDATEERTIWIERTVRERANDGGAERGRNDHATSSATCPRPVR